MTSNSFEQEIKERYKQAKKKIKDAAEKSNRDLDDIKLVAVGKEQPLEKLKFVRKLGVFALGESRVQELREKDEESSSTINWHFVGHLQRNKVKYLARMENCKLIHSLDSLRLAREINKRAGKNNRVMSVLVQVNVARDESKFGFMPEELLPFLDKAADLENISLEGLMTLVPYFEDSEKARPYFKQLVDLQTEAEESGYHLPELSMGMTNDYQVAIEEGATMIRLGREIFGPRNYE